MLNLLALKKKIAFTSILFRKADMHLNDLSGTKTRSELTEGEEVLWG